MAAARQGTHEVALFPAERRLRVLLRVLVIAFFVAALLYGAGPLIGPFQGLFKELPFVSNSVVKVSLLGMLCLYAAGNVRKRLALVPILIAAHVVSVATMVVFLLVADADRTVELGARTVAVSDILWGGIALDGLLTLVVLVFYAGARRAAGELGHVPDSAPGDNLVAGEQWLRRLVIALGVLFALAAVGYGLGPLLGPTRDFSIELPFVSNSVVKVATLAMLCVYIAKDLRRNMSLAGVLIAAHLVSVLTQFVFLLAADTDHAVRLGPYMVGMAGLLWGSIALDVGIAGILFLDYQAAWTVRFGLRYLRPMEYRTLIALAEVLIRGPDRRVPAADVAANVDGYISRIRARRRWVYRGSLFAVYLHPLLYCKAPFSELDEDMRLDHLKTHFRKAVILRLIPEWWRRLVQVVIRVAQQLTYVGYYNDPRSFSSVGYVPFSKRRVGTRDSGLGNRGGADHPLAVETPSSLTSTVLETDVCVIGSGAAGAILAYNLARAGRDVLVVERGRYVEPREFSEDEVEMIGKLYADGVFQQTQDFRFTVLQGSCVGGSTVVNNAVSFEPPSYVLERWNDPVMHHAGLNLGALRASVAAVTQFLSIASQHDAPLNPSAPKFLRGVEALGLPPQRLAVDVVRANIKDCLGCGYCNIGCAFGRKLSMLDTALPWAQQHFPRRVRIVAECEVRRLRALSGRVRRVIDARAALPDGRRVTIRAKTFVVSAGAIASSYLLLRSGIGLELPVGRRLSFNMGVPLTAEFDDVMNAYDGLQISHTGVPPQGRGFVFETWWNPPAAQAVNMPGWFEEHYENMRRYNRLMAVGVLVGTAGNARVRQAITGGPDISYTPLADDLKKMADGLTLLGRILFAAGARRVMANTWGYDVFTSPNDLRHLKRIALDPSYIALGTGHPQGGNAMSVDPRRGVVGPDFRVHGYENLYVCDASVFPTSLTVNPQLTVMSLAYYAASRIQ